ncbi:DUF255 domain-containing protein [bacterium]|nr:DUF255 domain-containing protein [bacterium]
MIRTIPLILALAAFVPVAAQEAAKPANRLARSASPYLLQHAHNPVDWYPWGPEAFERAKKENKPIFLSVGYAACHWCHVMEKESFSDASIAALMNDAFVCVKVDREERPDVDAVYMAALQSFSGGGGWPMNMILMPDGRPFFGMTYMPPRDKDGDEGFATLIARVRAAWRDNRAELERDASNLATAARRLAAAEAGLFRRGPVRKDLAAHTLQELADQFDPNYGGFGSTSRQPKAPKFPEPSILMFLWEMAENPAVLGDASKAMQAHEMALTTMDNIARGGIRDHLAGGIHRYSTDRYWTVPHFEKMLYDNALWLTVTATAFARTGDPRWQAEVQDTVTFLKTTMTQLQGGFDSSLDADTEGQEGLTYLWTKSEVTEAVEGMADADLFLWVYGVKLPPNFENRDHILAIAERWPSLTEENKLTEPEIRTRLVPIRQKLLEIRNRRKQPFKDDKCLTSWNGLAIGGLADAARLAKNPEALKLAESAARFLLDRHVRSSGLAHVSRGDVISPDGPFLEDYAYFVDGLLKLHAASGDTKWLEEGRKLAIEMIDHFEDKKNGGFFETVEGSTDLFVRPRNWFDSALPSPAGIATLVLIELAERTKDERFAAAARRSVDAASGYFTTSPDSVLSFVRAAAKLQAKPALAAEAGSKPESATSDDSKPARKKPKPVKAAIAGETPVEVVAGKSVIVTVNLVINDGYHTYANPPTDDSAKPTELRLDESASGPVRLLGVEYPEGKPKQLSSTGLEPVAVYEKEAALKARLEVPVDTPAGKISIVLVVDYQVCTDQFCLPPAKERIPVELKVTRP